jgi:hypothetical protein
MYLSRISQGRSLTLLILVPIRAHRVAASIPSVDRFGVPDHGDERDTRGGAHVLPRAPDQVHDDPGRA